MKHQPYKSDLQIFRAVGKAVWVSWLACNPSSQHPENVPGANWLAKLAESPGSESEYGKHSGSTSDRHMNAPICARAHPTCTHTCKHAHRHTVLIDTREKKTTYF